MFRNKKLVNGIISSIRTAANHTLDAFSEKRTEHEPSFTDRLLNSIELQIDGKIIGGVKWTAKTLTDRGANSQESEFGADFLGALSLEFDDYNVKKGFLAQAKIVEPSDTFPKKESERLIDQCNKMLNHTSDAFVFLYSHQSGIEIVPAVEVVSARHCNPHELTTKAITEFFKDHLECFIGDRSIQVANSETLKTLAKAYKTRNALLISGKSPNKGDNEKNKKNPDEPNLINNNDIRRRFSF